MHSVSTMHISQSLRIGIVLVSQISIRIPRYSLGVLSYLQLVTLTQVPRHLRRQPTLDGWLTLVSKLLPDPSHLSIDLYCTFPIIKASLALFCCDGSIPNSQISPLGDSFFRVGYLQIIQKWPPIWIPLDYFGAKRWRDKQISQRSKQANIQPQIKDQRNWRR